MSNPDLLDEVIAYAERYLVQSGVEHGMRPDVVEFDVTGESKVDYVPTTNSLIFHNVDPSDTLQLDEDTVKLLGRIYSGLEDDHTFDSESYRAFKVAMDSLPENWDLPFDVVDLRDAEEMRLGSELWRQRRDRIGPLVDRTRAQTRQLENSYDNAAEPLDEFSKMVAPNEEESIGVITEYMNSDIKTDVVDLLMAGQEEGLENLEHNKEEIYRRAESYGYSREEVDEKIDWVKQALPEVRDYVGRLDRAEKLFQDAIEWEIEDMMESEKPEPPEIATAYLLEPLINGSMEDPSMRDQVEEYIQSLEEEEGEQTRIAAEKIFNEYTSRSYEIKPTERFKQSVDEVRNQYYNELF